MHHCTMYHTTIFLCVHSATANWAVSVAVQCTMMYIQYKVMGLKKTSMYYVWTREITDKTFDFTDFCEDRTKPRV